MKNFTKWDGKIGAKVDKWKSCVYISGDICAHPGRIKGAYWNEDWCNNCPCLTLDEIDALCDYEIMGFVLPPPYDIFPCNSCGRVKETDSEDSRRTRDIYFCSECSCKNGHKEWIPKDEG